MDCYSTHMGFENSLKLCKRLATGNSHDAVSSLTLEVAQPLGAGHRGTLIDGNLYVDAHQQAAKPYS
jgi:hypothetical protein